MPKLTDVLTPAIILDLDKLERNCARMLARAEEFGVALRPHLKTAKSAEVAKVALAGRHSGVTVSTLAEVEYFLEKGYVDITYAVGITTQKIDRLAELQSLHNAAITISGDTVDAIRGAAIRARELDAQFRVLIEIDCGAGRGGVDPESDELVLLAELIGGSEALQLAGVLTHAGQSYAARSLEEISAIAETERAAAVRAAHRLRAAGHEVPCVSIGSTPTALCAKSLEGVTEIRPGVYMFMDLDQVMLGVATIDDIAVSVLATVIGQNKKSRCLLVDAGALAISKDLSADHHDDGIGYGFVCELDGGAPVPGLRVKTVHQEHGFIVSDDDWDSITDRYPVGTRLRILPNHACMTVASYKQYLTVRGQNPAILSSWDKATGW